MSNVGYDLDTSGGLMPLIRALIKPPDEEVSVQKPKRSQHPYYKRPGKGHNHDSCDACGEGGDLICCDRCPASFHLGCYDPPLDANDIPVGLWLCKECLGSDDNKPASTRSSRAQSPVDSKSDTEKKTRSLRNKRTSSKQKSEDVKEEEEEQSREEEKELSPMEILVQAAKIMNPTQFELPREMRIPCVFPGTEKECGKNGNGSLVSVDAWGCVPLPAAACFVCRGTCKQAPLLHCDYCPLLFHQDCLDPPLTALPTGRWMCPNHVEQYIDWKLVNSISATERVALWDKFSGPVDQQAVKVDFIRRARRPSPAFRIKVPVCGRGRVVVPGMVRLHYRQPPPLLPSRREYVRCRNVLKNLRTTGAYESTEEEEEMEDGPKHTICMNTECAVYTDAGECECECAAQRTHSTQRTLPAASAAAAAAAAALPGASDQDTADDRDAVLQPKIERHTDSSSDLSDSDFEYLTASVKKRKVSQSEDKSPNKRGRSERLELRHDGNVEQLLAAVDEQLKKLDERLVKLLAWQRLQQVLSGEQCYGVWRSTPLSARLASVVRGGVDRARLARLGLARAALPSELLSGRDRERIAAAVWGEPRPARSPREPACRPSPPATLLADAAVRATLCAIHTHAPNRTGSGDGLGRPIPMRLSSLTIGTDSGCDVRLDAAACRHVSRNHAVIFMDEVSRHFELINYSEWGSCVNGVMYACDAERAEPPHAPLAPDAPDAPRDTDARADALRDIVRHRQREPLKINGNLTSPLSGECGCSCGSGAGAGAGGAGGAGAGGAWEGSALVGHGALLQFGCQLFVFSITDAPPPPITDEQPSL